MDQEQYLKVVVWIVYLHKLLLMEPERSNISVNITADQVAYLAYHIEYHVNPIVLPDYKHIHSKWVVFNEIPHFLQIPLHGRLFTLSFRLMVRSLHMALDTRHEHLLSFFLTVAQYCSLQLLLMSGARIRVVVMVMAAVIQVWPAQSLLVILKLQRRQSKHPWLRILIIFFLLGLHDVAHHHLGVPYLLIVVEVLGGPLHVDGDVVDVKLVLF